MEGKEKLQKSKVLKIDSMLSWDHCITEANNKGFPVIVHFSASWCILCTLMNPVFQELSSVYQDVLFLMVDVDEVKNVASKMEIKAMPTFLLLNGGVAVDKLVGANPQELRKRVAGFVLSTTRSQNST